MARLSDRVIVVTGGASGLGEGIARRAAAHATAGLRRRMISQVSAPSWLRPIRIT